MDKVDEYIGFWKCHRLKHYWFIYNSDGDRSYIVLNSKGLPSARWQDTAIALDDHS